MATEVEEKKVLISTKDLQSIVSDVQEVQTLQEKKEALRSRISKLRDEMTDMLIQLGGGEEKKKRGRAARGTAEKQDHPTERQKKPMLAAQLLHDKGAMTQGALAKAMGIKSASLYGSILNKFNCFVAGGGTGDEKEWSYVAPPNRTLPAPAKKTTKKKRAAKKR